MSHTIPVGAEKIPFTSLAKSTQMAIKSILAKRGEAREIRNLWWNEAIQSYYILIDTATDEPATTHSVSFQSVFAITGNH